MKSTAGFVLALIGGILSILGSLPIILGGSALATAIPLFGTFGILGGIWVLAMGVVAIIAATMMKKDDNAKVKMGGIIALIVGIIGGNLLTLIGGIIGLVQSGK
ncbi:hypothetical protein GOV12_05510 [Candidatus Pacearchaeota archaeon]|nr:hypothetical protein [Candidatus Pacearchaeota archaeon]